ncbi:hypothetical protein ACJMK2_012723 [Sinanodonta woodiana]|uniref:N-terminal acetyltransferase B complex subunit NAA25 homolog n=1 Tax=Sinanodonta woodiana TaxID=1069815 RepID=A0ABD3VC56_SINWO
MASRSHVDVNERRLRPIYDCLDNGNNKKALQEADKVLKKQKTCQTAKVLKALALLRLGRQDESTQLLVEVHAEHPTDEAALQAMAICYREVHKMELIVDMYENAHKAKPDNEDILSALFMSYVRTGNHQKQQQTAMVLHKLKPQKNPYYFWAIMSIVMQAHNCKDPKLSKTMYLPLAERMTEKYVKESKIEAEAEVRLYLIILELLEKWDVALELLQGYLGDKFVSELNFREQTVAELYVKLKKWPEANAAYKNMLKKNPDQWNYWQEYVKATVELCEKPCPEDERNEDIDCTEEKAIIFINNCVKSCKDDRPLRGPYLAQLELIRQAQNRRNEPDRRFGDPVELLKVYFDLFGDRTCCFSDVKLFLQMLTEAEQSRFIESLESSCPLFNSGEPKKYAENVNEMQRHTTVLQTSRYLGFHDRLSTEGKLELAEDLLDRYKNGLKFGENFLSTELQPCDIYLLLASDIFIDVCQKTANSKLIWQIVIHLEKGLKKSPSNFQMKLILIKLYCTMGAFGPCPVLYDGMEIKHVMNDTLGHVVSNHVARLGHYTAACAMYGTMLRFFTVNHKETTEYLISSYKFGSFAKIHEFVKFREKLQNSLQYASATAERMLLDLVLETDSHTKTEQMITYMEIDPEKDKTEYDELCDNRDFAVMTNCEPPSRFNLKELQQKSFEEEKTWLKVRNLTMRVLAAAVILGREHNVENHERNGIENGANRPMSEICSSLKSQLENHLESHQCWSQDPKYPFQMGFRTRLCTYLQNEHHKLLLGMLDNVLYANTLQDNGIDKIDNVKEEKLKSCVPSLLEGLVSKHKCSLVREQENGHCINADAFENLVLCAESVSHIAVLAGVCHRILKPFKAAFNKRNKKKKGLKQPPTFEHYNQMLTGLEKATRDLHEGVKKLDPVFLSIDLSNLKLTDSLSNKQEDVEFENEIWKKVELSYQQSSIEVTELLYRKMQYLASLKLL